MLIHTGILKNSVGAKILESNLISLPQIFTTQPFFWFTTGRVSHSYSNEIPLPSMYLNIVTSSYVIYFPRPWYSEWRDSERAVHREACFLQLSWDHTQPGRLCCKQWCKELELASFPGLPRFCCCCCCCCCFWSCVSQTERKKKDRGGLGTRLIKNYSCYCRLVLLWRLTEFNVAGCTMIVSSLEHSLQH